MSTFIVDFFFYAMEKLILTTEDHASLAVHLFKPEKSNGKLLLINSATGVKQQVYFLLPAIFLSRNSRLLPMTIGE